MLRLSFTSHAIRILSLLMVTTSAFGMSPPLEYFDQSDTHTQTPLPQPPPHLYVPANHPQYPQDPQAAWLDKLLSDLPLGFPPERKNHIQEIVRVASGALPQPKDNDYVQIPGGALFLPPHKSLLLSLGHPTSNSDVIDNFPNYSTRWYAEILRAEQAWFTREKARLKEEAKQQAELQKVATEAASDLQKFMLAEAQEYNLLLQSAKAQHSTIAENAFRQSLNSLQDEESTDRQGIHLAEKTGLLQMDEKKQGARCAISADETSARGNIKSLEHSTFETAQKVLAIIAQEEQGRIKQYQDELPFWKGLISQKDKFLTKQQKAMKQACKEEQQQKQQMHEALQKKQQKAKSEKKGGKKKPPQMSREEENELLGDLAASDVASPESASAADRKEDWTLFVVLLTQEELPEFPEELPKALPKPLQEKSPEELREPMLLNLMRMYPEFASKPTIVPNTQLKKASKATPLQPREAKQIKKKVKQHQHPITLELQTTKNEKPDNNPTTVLQWMALRRSPNLLQETIDILDKEKKLEHEINRPSQPASGYPTQPTFIALAYAAIHQCPEKAAILLNAGSEPGITSITAAFMNNSPEALSLILKKRAQNKAPEATLSDKTKLLKLDAEAGVNIAFLKIAVRYQKGQDEKLLPTLLTHIKKTTSPEMYNSILYTLFFDTNIIDTMSHDQFEQILTLYGDEPAQEDTHLSIRLVPRILMRIANKKEKQGVHDAEGDAILELFFKRYPSALNTAVAIKQADGAEDICTPLDFAVEARADGATMKMLLDLGADPTQNTTKETLPAPNTLHRAAALRHAPQLAYMLQYNPEWITTKGNDGKNLLHTVLGKRLFDETASKWEEDLVVATVKAILDQPNAEEIINQQSDCGDTPLHTAAKAGNIKSVKLLLQKGANPALINCENNTPLKVARKEIEKWQTEENNLSEALKKAMKNDLALENSATLTQAQILSYKLIMRMLVESKAERLQNVFDQQDRGEAHPFRDKNAVIVASLRIFGFPEDEAKSAGTFIMNNGKSFEEAMTAVIPELASGK